jgi:hypothetical protein
MGRFSGDLCSYINEVTMFGLDEKQREKLNTWLEEIKPEILEKQKGLKSAPRDRPYYGASGGGITYKFTPTSLGIVIEVTEYRTQKTLDLTDYDSW